MPRPVLGPISLLFNGFRYLFLRVQGDHGFKLSPYSIDIKSEWISTSTVHMPSRCRQEHLYLYPLIFFLALLYSPKPCSKRLCSFLQVRIGGSRAKCFWYNCCFGYFVFKVCKKKLCGIIRDLKWIIRNNKARFQNVLPWYHASLITLDSWGFIFTYSAIICS